MAESEVVEVYLCEGGFCVKAKRLEVKRPPFLSYLLPIETPEQLAEALAFARSLKELR